MAKEQVLNLKSARRLEEVDFAGRLALDLRLRLLQLGHDNFLSHLRCSLGVRHETLIRESRNQSIVWIQDSRACHHAFVART